MDKDEHSNECQAGCGDLRKSPRLPYCGGHKCRWLDASEYADEAYARAENRERLEVE